MIRQLLGDVRIEVKMGELLLLTSTSNQLAPPVQNIQRCYMKARRNVKNVIKKRIESYNEDENSENKTDQSDCDGKISDFFKRC